MVTLVLMDMSGPCIWDPTWSCHLGVSQALGEGWNANTNNNSNSNPTKRGMRGTYPSWSGCVCVCVCVDTQSIRSHTASHLSCEFRAWIMILAWSHTSKQTTPKTNKISHLMYNSSNVTDRRNSSNVKRIQNMNSHFKSKNYKEGSKSQHNQQNRLF